MQSLWKLCPHPITHTSELPDKLSIQMLHDTVAAPAADSSRWVLIFLRYLS